MGDTIEVIGPPGRIRIKKSELARHKAMGYEIAPPPVKPKPAKTKNAAKKKAASKK